MSIESTSVPNPVVREIENSSKRNAWSETQGSATGSKDGQFSSFWDKAFAGAQRLFGIDNASKDEAVVGEDHAVENEERENALRRRLAEKRFDATPGFGSSGFHRFSVSPRREDPPGLVMLSSRDRFRDSQPEASALDETIREDRLRESAAAEDRRSRWDDELEDESEDDEKQAKTADPPVLSPPPFAKNPSNISDSVSLNADNQQLTVSNNPVGINPAKQGAMMNSLASNSKEETAGEAMVPVEASDAVSSGSVRRTHASEARAVEIDSSAVKRNAIAQEGEASKQNLIPARKAQSNVLTSQKAGEVSSEGNGKDADSLLIDADKTKRTLSSFLEGARSASSNKGIPVSTSGSLQSQSSGMAAGQEVGSSDKENGTESTSKSVDTSKGGASKNLAGAYNRSDAARPHPNGFDQAVSGLSASRRGTRSTSGNAIQSSGTSPLAGNSTRPVGGPTAGANSSNVARGTAADGPLFQERLSDSSLKSLADAKASSKPAESGAISKPTLAAPKSEGTQAVQLSGSDVSGSRKTAFAPKAQVLNYASKSTEETSEVYKALSKSVDRLATGKNETISIRLNFDQGGTMALRVSMDSGQINAAMQTDLPGLESLIKASWSEFATELNQKGLKIGSPQFSQLENESLKNENTLGFEQKGSQSKGESSNDPQSRKSRQAGSSSPQGADASTAESAQAESEEGPDSDQELETYA